MKFIAEETTAATNAHQHGLNGEKWLGEMGKRWQGVAPLVIPSGYLTVCHGKSPFSMGKSTINGYG
jgi:hypothetical protein